MPTSSELSRCSHCDCWFAAAASDEVFFHASRGCRRDTTRQDVLVERRATPRYLGQRVTTG